LKCSSNIKVYDTSKLSETHFVRFEGEMKAQEQWYQAEQSMALSKRLSAIYEARARKQRDTVKDLTGAFDLRAVRRRADTCNTNGKGILVNMWTCSTSELFADCAAIKWWRNKLQNWHRAMPFSTFMMPQSQLQDDVKPGSDDQVMVCFGKRVASQLHRRKDGDHLMTDQNTVGCHGFWTFTMAAKMMKRITDLWRPPTCQLAAMELEFKIKILEMINDMNDRLFDALPSMLVEDMASFDNWDGKPLQSAKGLGIMQGVWKSIVQRFQGLKGTYTRLGKLLGNTVVKWAVCPLKEITNQTELDQLDSVLGTEDSVARWYARIAYAKHTGEKMLLPGERCNGTVEWSSVAKTCDLAQMRESMPEPYKDIEFVCPIRPMLPAKQQLEVFKAKVDHCMLRMTDQQMGRANWFNAGHAPTKLQYNKSQNLPSEDYQAVQVLKPRSAPDAHFGVWREFYTLGLGCTEKEKRLTPRFCGIPVRNDQGNQVNLLTKDGMVGASSTVSAKGLGRWFGRRFKGLEGWLKRTGSSLFGKAGTRREKLKNKFFVEAETSDLIHSMSFQKQMRDDGADSKNRVKFQRFAVSVPCPYMDPERKYDLTYQWNEIGIELFRKANAFDAAFASFELRGMVEFRQSSETSYRMSYKNTYRVGKMDLNGDSHSWGGWEDTSNPIIGSQTGVLNSHNEQAFSASGFKGFTAHFACGTRVAVHDLPDDVSAKQENWTNVPLKKCIQDGVKTNQELRKAKPGEPFYPDEVVLRITTVAPLSCDASTSGWQGDQSADSKARKVWRSISGISSQCNRGDTSHVFRVSWFKGSTLPDNILTTTVLDVEDVQQAIRGL